MESKALEWMECEERYQVQLDSASSLAAKPENLICEQAGAVGTVGITDLARGASFGESNRYEN